MNNIATATTERLSSHIQAANLNSFLIIQLSGSREQGAGRRESRGAEGAEGAKNNCQLSSRSVAPAFTVNQLPTTNYRLPVTNYLCQSQFSRSHDSGLIA
ncbi:hypothetical protein [Chroococcidiopsis sp.]|uniref:hypothetical protein n=1 Tax=Chroococcidiopsis sp. TaxID=3088168 RepID=UPI003F3BB19D